MNIDAEQAWNSLQSGIGWDEAFLRRTEVHVASIRPMSPCGQILRFLSEKEEASDPQVVSELAEVLPAVFVGQLIEITAVLEDDGLLLAHGDDDNPGLRLTSFGRAVAAFLALCLNSAADQTSDSAARPVAASRSRARSSFQALAGS